MLDSTEIKDMVGVQMSVVRMMSGFKLISGELFKYVVSLPKDLREGNIGLKILNFHILPMEAVRLPIRTQKELKW